MKLAFFGTPAFAVPSLEALIDSKHDVRLVVAQPDRPAGRGMKLMRPPVAVAASAHGIETVQPERLDETIIQTLRALDVELAVVVAYGKILRPALLEAVPHGFINVHASLLPKWRGAAPVQRAIEAGENETGVSIMRIDEQLDHGPVFATARVAIGADDRAPEVFDRLAATGGELLVEVIDAIENGTSTETPQNHDDATHAAKIAKEEARVDWAKPARSIYDRFRAFYPWPGLFFEHAGETIRITDIAGVEKGDGGAGQIVSLEGESALIGTGDALLRIRALQRPGRRAAAAPDVLRGVHLAQGDRIT